MARVVAQASMSLDGFIADHSDQVGPLFERVQRVAADVVPAMGAQGSFVAMYNKVSQSVPHLHVHVVPRTKGDGLQGFFWPRTKYETEDAAAAVAAAIAAELSPPG